ncbi:MAG: aminotransferase class IV [Castellaniella sp.]|uniref:aminotransferase class IV n=1 Tax=Castellaniella sp. TaxID=1955812 RepID=UPI001227F539|nr:aminotransferase class IV [Castellaniella sp.]TAN29540.1 MAG: aminotransferase class IV [Castellaniella sp.]
MVDFDILETFALRGGTFARLPLHLARMRAAAHHFGYPWPEPDITQMLAQLCAQHAQGDWRIRLALRCNGHLATEAHPLPLTLTPVRLQLAREPLTNAMVHGDWVRFKTSRREHYSALRPADASVFDTLLFNEDGELTETTHGNIAALLDNRWVTPPLHCGLLPGVGRHVLVQQGRLAEQVIELSDVPRAQGWAFVNSLRGWLDADLVG